MNFDKNIVYHVRNTYFRTTRYFVIRFNRNTNEWEVSRQGNLVDRFGNGICLLPSETLITEEEYIEELTLLELLK